MKRLRSFSSEDEDATPSHCVGTISVAFENAPALISPQQNFLSKIHQDRCSTDLLYGLFMNPMRPIRGVPVIDLVLDTVRALATRKYGELLEHCPFIKPAFFNFLKSPEADTYIKMFVLLSFAAFEREFQNVIRDGTQYIWGPELGHSHLDMFFTRLAEMMNICLAHPWSDMNIVAVIRDTVHEVSLLYVMG